MFPEHWSFEHLVSHAVKEILVNQKIILHNQARNQGEIMSALTDAQDAFARLKALVEAFIATKVGGATDADLQSLTAEINALAAEVSPPAPPA